MSDPNKSRLDQYKGHLTPANVAAGINAANANARRLAKDAKDLFELGRYPSAASLAILSIEEAGKSSILRGMALAKSQTEMAAHWKQYRQHTAKNMAWILVDLVSKGARKLEDFAAIYDMNSDHPEILDQVKQIAFYTDCLGKAHWSIPDDVISYSLAESLVQIAGVLAPKSIVQEREIELWIEHMKPVWMGPKAWMDTALIRWSEAMREAGLSIAGDMEEFVRGQRGAQS